MPVGQPAMPVIRFADDPERRRTRRWCGLVTAGGAYAHPTHNWFVSAAHTEEDVARTLEAAERAPSRPSRPRADRQRAVRRRIVMECAGQT